MDETFTFQRIISAFLGRLRMHEDLFEKVLNGEEIKSYKLQNTLSDIRRTRRILEKTKSNFLESTK